MRKIINMGYYDNNYSGSEFNCISQPIAAIADLFCCGNYYYYAFYDTFFTNWAANEEYYSLDLLEKSNLILLKLGLKMKRHRISNISSLLPEVKNSISNNMPVIVLLRRKTLIYAEGIPDSPHGVIVSGYDDSISRVLLRDAPQVEDSGARFEGSGYGLFNLWLREDLLEQMWYESNFFHKSDVVGSIFTVIQSGECKINSYIDLFIDFKKEYSFSKNMFEIFIKSHEFEIENFIDDEYASSFRRWIILPKKIIVDSLLKCADEVGYSNVSGIIEFCNMMMDNYSKMINVLCVYAKRQREFSSCKKEEFIEQIRQMDICLNEFVEKILLFADVKIDNV